MSLVSSKRTVPLCLQRTVPLCLPSNANDQKTKKPFIKTFGIGVSTSKFDVSISTSRTFYITKVKWKFLGNAKNKLVSFIDALL